MRHSVYCCVHDMPPEEGARLVSEVFAGIVVSPKTHHTSQGQFSPPPLSLDGPGGSLSLLGISIGFSSFPLREKLPKSHRRPSLLLLPLGWKNWGVKYTAERERERGSTVAGKVSNCSKRKKSAGVEGEMERESADEIPVAV